MSKSNLSPKSRKPGVEPVEEVKNVDLLLQLIRLGCNILKDLFLKQFTNTDSAEETQKYVLNSLKSIQPTCY